MLDVMSVASGVPLHKLSVFDTASRAAARLRAAPAICRLRRTPRG
jgi:hypothetical protein